MAEGSVSVELSVDEQKALKALTSLSKKFDEFADDAKNSFKKTDMALSSFAGNLASTAVSKGFGLISDGFKALVGSIDDFIEAGAEQQKTLNDFNTALAISGKYTKQASQNFQDFASAVQASTGIGDDAIIALGTRIQNIARLSETELQKATKATIDFSSALGIDLESAGSLVGKALEGNVGALGRYGLAVKKGANETETFNNVLTALSAFSGTAESKLNTFSGASGAVSERIGDLKESIGALIIQNPVVVAGLKAFEKAVLLIDEKVKENKEVIIQLINSALVPMVKIGSSATMVLIEMADAFLRVTESVKGNAIESSLEGLKNQLQEIRTASQNFIDPNTGEKIKSTGEQWLEIQIQQAEKSLEEQRGYAEKRRQLFQTIGDSVSQVEASITGALTTSAQKQIEIQNQTTNQYLMNLSAKNMAEQEAIIAHNETVRLLQDSQLMSLRTAQSDYELEQKLKDDENFQFLVANLGREEALREVARATELQKTGGHNASLLSLRAARVKAEQNQIFALQKYEDLSNKQRLDNLKSTFGVMANLQSSSSKELFMIGKASALAIATVDGIQAIQKALASAPPPFNYALAAAVGVVQAGNLAKIASSKPPQGMENGGIVGGSSYFGDKVPMNLNSREMVLNRQQQTKLFNDINNGGNSGNVVQAINNLGDRIARMNIIVQANSREIARLVRDEREAGFAI